MDGIASMDRRFRVTRRAEEHWPEAVEPRYGEPGRVDVDAAIEDLRRNVRRSAKAHVPVLVGVLDEGLQFIIHLEQLLLANSHGPSAFAFCTLVARMRSLAISFRELVLLGQTDSARLIARAFLETSELATVAMADPQFAVSYAPDDPLFDDKRFWKKNIAYGRIYEALRETYRRAGISKEFVEHAVDWRRVWKDDLSGAVHCASWSAFQCAFVPSIETPGSCYVGGLGALSAHSPPLCKLVLEEMWLFSEVFVNLLHSNPVPSNLRGFPTGAGLASTLAAEATFKKVFHEFESDLSIDREKLFPPFEEADEAGETESVQQGHAADGLTPAADG